MNGASRHAYKNDMSPRNCLSNSNFQDDPVMKNSSLFPAGGKVATARTFAIDTLASPLLLPVSLLVYSGLAQAVAGGAGGGGGSSSDSGDGLGAILEIVFWIIFSLPFPYNLIALVILVLIVRSGTKRVRSVSGLNDIPSVARLPEKTFALPATFITRNPGFTPFSLLAKANTAFLAIQQAWTRQDMARVRRWISDGVWQRFTTQIMMMRLLGQQNVVSNVQIKKAVSYT